LQQHLLGSPYSSICPLGQSRLPSDRFQQNLIFAIFTKILSTCSDFIENRTKLRDILRDDLRVLTLLVTSRVLRDKYVKRDILTLK
jgi:hypothetical protein